jgi:hypothetical protein
VCVWVMAPEDTGVYGRDEAVVIVAEEFCRLRGNQSGLTLVEAMQSSPHEGIEIAVPRAPMPVRDVALSPAGSWAPMSFQNCAARMRTAMLFKLSCCRHAMLRCPPTRPAFLR